ncbi:MAG: diphthine--ammonia ligase [Nanoarchaeota archaeon]|nr:diphthine--ammonia ligase [Nanoarchaeota archaeon]
MKLAALYSGGKDSNFALWQASKEHTIKCLITLKSKNPDSYMFQTPGINMTKIQSECLNIPIINQATKGEKEKELTDLKKAIKKAINEYKIEGIVTGAIKSTYQASRIQKICNELNIWCINPIWQINEIEFLKQLIKNKFKVIIVAIASYPLTKTFLGKELNKELIIELEKIANKYGFNPAGEGGELETLVLDSPLFKSKINITKFNTIMDSENSGKIEIENWIIKKK